MRAMRPVHLCKHSHLIYGKGSELYFNLSECQLHWIGHVNGMDCKRQVSQEFKINPQGSRLRGRPKTGWRSCVQTDISKCKITNWKDRSKNISDWEKSIKEVKVGNGL
jgi:hypothetical protein